MSSDNASSPEGGYESCFNKPLRYKKKHKALDKQKKKKRNKMVWFNRKVEFIQYSQEEGQAHDFLANKVRFDMKCQRLEESLGPVLQSHHDSLVTWPRTELLHAANSDVLNVVGQRDVGGIAPVDGRQGGRPGSDGGR